MKHTLAHYVENPTGDKYCPTCRLHRAAPDLLEVFELAKDYIEGMHDYHLHADFETVRVPIARDKREKLAAAIEKVEGRETK